MENHLFEKMAKTDISTREDFIQFWSSCSIEEIEDFINVTKRKLFFRNWLLNNYEKTKTFDFIFRISWLILIFVFSLTYFTHAIVNMPNLSEREIQKALSVSSSMSELIRVFYFLILFGFIIVDLKDLVVQRKEVIAALEEAKVIACRKIKQYN